MPHESRIQGVPVDVTRDPEQVSPERHPAQPCLSCLPGHAGLESLNGTQEFVFLCAGEEVIVIAHGAVGVDLDGEPLGNLAQNHDERGSVF